MVVLVVVVVGREVVICGRGPCREDRVLSREREKDCL